jgi:hypothetical protein
MIDVLVCTNLVNYTVALHGMQPGRRRPALLIHEPWRFVARPLPRVHTFALGLWSLRLLRALVALRLVHTLYLPHDRFNWRVAWARAHVPRLAYLDDGLDTHRRTPRNFDLPVPPRRGGRPAYLSFNECQRLPDWLAAFDVWRCAPLTALAGSSGLPLLPLDGIDVLLVESPGLQPAQVIGGLGLSPARVLVIRHPVPAKRGRLPGSCRRIEGGGHDLEASLLQARGLTLVFGETMALVFAALSGVAHHNRVLAQLTPAQRDNLPGLRWCTDAQDLAEVPGLLALAA